MARTFLRAAGLRGFRSAARSGWTGNHSSGDWAQITATSRRGFTFQEHMDNLSLVHINGRMCDPYPGRILSADLLIPDPTRAQSFSRYSYVCNIQRYFERVGLDIEELTVPLTREKHRLKPDGIHANGGGNWNKAWEDSAEANPNATEQQILDQLERMRQKPGT